MVRLGVNIDHVATLRQQRDEAYPCISKAAACVLEAGADQITIHLREDRRHIQDSDLQKVQEQTKKYQRPLNLEMGCDTEIMEIGAKIRPEWFCLVPEKREEKTTEGGLDLSNEKTFEKVLKTLKYLRKESPASKISLFLEANTEVLKKAKELQVEAVEIHTGHYAHDFLKGLDCSYYLESFVQAHKYLSASGIATHAGHGLTDESTKELVSLGIFEEYNIGHWIVAESVFCGMGELVKRLNNIIKGER